MLNSYKPSWLEYKIQIHNVCLNCGHRKDEHSSDGSRCHNDLCLCRGFKTTFLQYGSDLWNL